MKLEINGVAIKVATASPVFIPDRPSLILVHGAANDSDAWRDVMPALAVGGINVFAPDLPGHGASGGKPLASIEKIADWLLSLVAALGLDQTALAGHSMGSLAALEAAARGGRRISRLALLGAAVPMPVSDVLRDTARRQPDAACRMVATWSHTPDFFIRGGGGHGVWGVGKTLAVMRRNSGTLAGDLGNCNAYGNGLQAAAAVNCPTTLILGRRDRMTPLRNVEPLAAALSDARRHVIADCGHAMMVEQPGEVAAALKTLCSVPTPAL